MEGELTPDEAAPDNDAVLDKGQDVEVAAEEKNPVWNALLVVVKTPVRVKICVVSGHAGQGWNTVDLVVDGPFSCKVLIICDVVSVLRGVVPVAKPVPVVETAPEEGAVLDEKAVPDRGDVEVAAEEENPVWNTLLVVVKIPVIVKIWEVSGHAGQG